MSWAPTSSVGLFLVNAGLTPFDSVQFAVFVISLYVTGTMDDMALSNQAKQWIAKALQSSARSSRKIVEAEAHSLCKKESNRKQFQYGRYNGYRVLNYAARMGCQLLFDLLTKKLMVDPNIPDSVDGRVTPLPPLCFKFVLFSSLKTI